MKLILGYRQIVLAEVKTWTKRYSTLLSDKLYFSFMKIKYIKCLSVIDHNKNIFSRMSDNLFIYFSILKKGTILLFLLSSIFVNGQNISSKSDMFILCFARKSKILETNYNDNQLIMNKMSSVIEPIISDLKNGLAHLELTGYITNQNPESINNVSIQASVVRAYIKIKYGLSNDCFTFKINNLSNTENSIGVAVKYSDIADNDNRNIYYTLTLTTATLNKVLAQYGSIPYIKSNSVPFVDNIAILPFKKSREIAESLDVINYNLKNDSIISKSDKNINVLAIRTNNAIPTINNLSKRLIEKAILHPLFAIKTNLIYWAGFTPSFEQVRVSNIPNIEVEYYFSKRYSLSIDGVYTPFVRKKLGSEWRYFDGFAIEPRVWLSNNTSSNINFLGVYTGFYGITGEFDFMHPSLGNFGYTGSYYGAGISLGFVFPLFKGFAIEVGSRGGYRIDRWESYQVEDGSYYFIDSGSQRGFKLQGIRLAIMYRFGSKLLMF